MVEVMKACKRVEIQLISKAQQDSIMNAAKVLAEKYKRVKSILTKGNL
jgi:hypothetical protein